MEAGALLPVRATPFSAGLDLFSSEEAVVRPNTRRLISTGLSIRLPKDSYGRIAPRSGLSLRGYEIGGGVIDSDYRGIVKVIMINNSNENYIINFGDKIAQLIVERIYNLDPVLVTELDVTERGEKGFGSTGT